MKHLKRLWRRPDFMRLTIGQTLSQLGDQVGVIAVLTLIYRWTHSATAVSSLLTAQLLPVLILGCFAGPLVDMLPRRRLMIAIDLLRAAVTFGYLFAGTTWQLLALAAVRSAAGTLYGPARDALLPELLEADDLETAVAASQSTQQTARMIGPVVGGLAVAALGLPSAILFDALSFLLSAALLWERSAAAGAATMRAVRPAVYWQQMREGMGFLVRHPLLRSLSGAKAAALIGAGAVNALLVAYVRESPLGETGLGFILGAIGAGSVAGSLLSAPLSRRVGMRSLIGWGAATVGLSLAAALQSPWRLGVLGAFLVLGLGLGVLNFGLFTLVQQATPAAFKGRVFAVSGSLETAVIIASIGAAGILADRIGVVHTYYIAALFLLLAALWAAFLPFAEQPSHQAGGLHADS